jgi:hypothetical protein
MSEEFLSKDEFFTYVIDNRDRQDANKDEIITTLTAHIDKSEARCQDDIDTMGGRVEKLEDYQKKQNMLGVVLGAITASLLAFLK